MRTPYLIFIVENGTHHYYGKTPIAAQAYAVKYSLETEQGKTVRIMKDGQWR